MLATEPLIGCSADKMLFYPADARSKSLAVKQKKAHRRRWQPTTTHVKGTEVKGAVGASVRAAIDVQILR